MIDDRLFASAVFFSHPAPLLLSFRAHLCHSGLDPESTNVKLNGNRLVFVLCGFRLGGRNDNIKEGPE